MTIINFQEIKYKKDVSGVCIECGKRKKRIISESQTVNPFNKNTDGSIKNYSEVSQSVSENLQKRLERFKNEGFVCSGCKKYLGY